MKNIKVVIGANFGDEGKGLMTDYFAYNNSKNGIVIRFNGGSQAGHTVVTPESLRHVFSHFGSGTFVGLPTYLSDFFIINPMMFKKEYEGLDRKTIKPVTYINSDCLVTTPYDMLINQIAEITRDNKKHGSCGIGINETIRRNDKLSIRYKDLNDIDTLIFQLVEIRDIYVSHRLKELGVNSISIEYMDLLKNDNIIVNYINDVKFMLNNSAIKSLNFLNSFDNIIFEGAQGLLLDQNSNFFPNVTPSNTGIKNVVKIIKDLKWENENIEIVYITRNYMTRHGAGSFPTEIKEKPFKNIIDLTNISNRYQGDLRFGILNIDLLKDTINKDIENTKDLKYKVSLAVTCLDQVDGEVEYIVNSRRMKGDINYLLSKLFDTLNMKDGYLSYGITRHTIKSLEYGKI